MIWITRMKGHAVSKATRTAAAHGDCTRCPGMYGSGARTVILQMPMTVIDKVDLLRHQEVGAECYAGDRGTTAHQSDSEWLADSLRHQEVGAECYAGDRGTTAHQSDSAWLADSATSLSTGTSVSDFGLPRRNETFPPTSFLGN